MRRLLTEGVEGDGLGLDCFENVGNLEGDGFKCRAGDVAGGGATAQADEHAAGVGVPMRCAEADKGGDEDDSACIGNAGGEGFDVG
jgi:hypothetical protein